MKRFRLMWLIATCLLLATSAWSGPDRYSGDASIYEGVAQDVGRPNIMFIIDNSMATLKTVSTVEYDSSTVYDVGVSRQGGSCVGVDNANAECWQPWNIYKQDNQGDFATRVMTNATDALETLSAGLASAECLGDRSYVLSYFQNYGSYSGSGADPFPNLTSTGSCDWAVNNSSGTVYALGNYLNYLKNAAGVGVGGGDGECAPPDVASITYTETYCTQPNKTVDDCLASKLATRERTGYFQALQTHVSESINHPLTGANSVQYWTDLGANLPEGATPVEWAVGITYEFPECNAGGDGGGLDVTSVTQREVMFETLKDVVGATATIVNFGAMVYGGNNSGGDLLAGATNLALDLDTEVEGAFEVVVAPDCFNASDPDYGTPYCQFFRAIPGPDRNGDGDFNDADTDGASPVSSNTLRPQAEAVFDAGYYFGAGRTGEADSGSYVSITNNTQIDPADSPCGLNHIILITNGFSNGDSSPNMDVVGDADGDNYANEEVYGLGSHWLDDVARYLNAEHGITTHTVLAFQAYDDLVSNAAHDGGGQFHLASNSAQLRKALLNIIASIINEVSTSFVAPVVPASTTNRTISSNRVYLGLFKPQDDGPWYGNVKKYGLTSDNRLAEPPADSNLENGDPATYPDGEFDPNSISFWSLINGLVPAAEGDIDPNNTDVNALKGDGGEVAAGGVGGVLLKRVQQNATYYLTGAGQQNHRQLFTFLPDGFGGWTKQSLIRMNGPNSWSYWPAVFDALDLDGDTSDLGWWDTANWISSTAFWKKLKLMMFVHGHDALNVNAGESGYDVRDWVMGDVLHSRPVVFNYTRYEYPAESVCQENASEGQDYNSSIIFVGGNDGMLHAFRDCDGKELWGFVPDNVLGNLKYLPDALHTNYFDSPPSILFYDQEEDGNVDIGEDLVVLVIGQRRGGGKNMIANDDRGAYYALDITNPLSPTLMWKLDMSDYPELAETWSLASIQKLKVDGSTDIRYVAFISAGYDNNEDLRYGTTQTFPADADTQVTDINYAPKGGSVDGLDANGDIWLQTSPGTDTDGYAMRGKAVAAILVAQLQEQDVTFNQDGVSVTEKRFIPRTDVPVGTLLWSSSNIVDIDNSYSFASDIRTLDLNNNGGYIDRLYVGDTGGRMWRFDTEDRDPANWTGEIIFKSNPGTGASSDTIDNTDVGRKFFYPPAVAETGGTTWVCFNSGDREHPLNLPVVDRLYCVKDFDQVTADGVDESKLVDVTENLLQASASADEVEAIYNKLYSNPASLVDDTFYYGWYIKLDGKDRDPTNGEYGEKALSEPVIFQNQVFFSTYQIKTGARSECEAGNLGLSRLYRVDLETGEAVFNYDLTNDSSTPPNDRAAGADGEVLLRTDRVYDLGEGIPSGIVQVVDEAGNVSLLISSSDKVEGISGSNPTVTFPVYWLQGSFAD